MSVILEFLGAYTVQYAFGVICVESSWLGAFALSRSSSPLTSLPLRTSGRAHVDGAASCEGNASAASRTSWARVARLSVCCGSCSAQIASFNLRCTSIRVSCSSALRLEPHSVASSVLMKAGTRKFLIRSNSATPSEEIATFPASSTMYEASVIMIGRSRVGKVLPVF